MTGYSIMNSLVLGYMVVLLRVFSEYMRLITFMNTSGIIRDARVEHLSLR